jgi:hypothetical protein
LDWQEELGACPDCGSVEWQVVTSHDAAINFLCQACGACWFHCMGWLTRVDPVYEAIERRPPDAKVISASLYPGSR